MTAASDTIGDGPPCAAAASLGRLVRQREAGLILVILLLFAVMSFASPYFLTWENMRAMTMAFAVEGIVVVGMTILLISGGIDLSVGSVVAFAMVFAGWLFLAGVDPWVASALAIAASAGIGAAMGFCVTRIGLHHFIVSLAFMVIARGVCLLFTGGRPLGALHPAAGVQVHRPGLDRRHPLRHHHLRGLRAGLRLPAPPLDRLPQGLLHRQQREGGGLFRHPHQAGDLLRPPCSARRSRASPASSTWRASARRSRPSASAWSSTSSPRR